MMLIFRIAFRNIFRRKARSLLMGLGICLSMMIMVVGYSFSKGISLNVINKLVDTNVIGHIMVSRMEKNGTASTRVIRDRDSLVRKIKENLPNVKDVQETLTTASFAVGNGKGGTLTLTGMGDAFDSIAEELSLVDGDMSKVDDDTIENPLILAQSAAKRLNVKPGDILKIRLNTIYGQVQTARLTLVATVESKNLYIGMFIQGLLPLDNLKTILGYLPEEAGSLNVTLKRVDETSRIGLYADRLHDMLVPAPVSIAGNLSAGGKEAGGSVVGLQSDKESAELWAKTLKVASGSMEDFKDHAEEALIGRSLAERLNLSPGMDLAFSYPTRFGEGAVQLKFKVAAIVEDAEGFASNLFFINEDDFFDTWSNQLPLQSQEDGGKFVLGADSSLLPAIAREWKLAERSHTAAEFQRNMKEIKNSDAPAPVLIVSSLSEEAEELFQMESSINIASMVVMIVVFAIILVGLVNSVRMNIRERTREIGTVRALGMQKKMVARILISEVFILSILSVLAGVVLSRAAMGLLSMMSFPIANNALSVFLKNGHLQFMTPVRPIVINGILLVLVTMLTAWFPSRKAARMQVADALGHFE